MTTLFIVPRNVHWAALHNTQQCGLLCPFFTLNNVVVRHFVKQIVVRIIEQFLILAVTELPGVFVLVVADAAVVAVVVGLLVAL